MRKVHVPVCLVEAECELTDGDLQQAGAPPGQGECARGHRRDQADQGEHGDLRVPGTGLRPGYDRDWRLLQREVCTCSEASLVQARVMQWTPSNQPPLGPN